MHGALASGVVLLCLVVACTPHRAYRVPEGALTLDPDELARAQPEQLEGIERHAVEEHEDFTLGFIELDDQGYLWSRAQVAEVEQAILAAAARPHSRGVLIAVLVHGWKHDARVCDENVACFRQVLRGLENFEAMNALRYEAPPRRVVGVFVGWRGLSVTPPGLRETSFWGRKATAHRVGRGQLVEVLTRLEQLRDHLADSRLVIVGHSFGAGVAYSALGPLFQERLARAVAGEPRLRGHPAGTRVEGFGDLVVLVNPAFEAARYHGLHELARGHRGWDSRQPAILVTVSSESDRATSDAFPVGRFFSTLFTRTRDGEQRRALRTALGNYEPYRTHELEVASTRGAALERRYRLDDLADPRLDDLADPQLEALTRGGGSGCGCSLLTVRPDPELDPTGELRGSALRELTERGNQGVFGGTRLRPVGNDIHPFDPFLVVRASDEIVTRHNGIYNPLFIDFLRELVLEMDDRRRQAGGD